MISEPFDWYRFHAYRVFDEFLERFVLQRRSYVTQHIETLDLEAAFEDIRRRFCGDSYDDSDAKYEEKIAHQFSDAPEETKIVFANVEYLWAMPVANLRPRTKRAYGERWFSGSDLLVEGERYFFDYPHIIADPGPWYLRNKYWELVALLRVLHLVVSESGRADVAMLKRQIAGICHRAIYEGVPSGEVFAAPIFCGVHCALLHLSDPERYESIISASHRRQIISVFRHVVRNPSSDDEVLLKQIRQVLYDAHGIGEEADRKYRWFFYSKDVQPLWIDKKTPKQQQVSSAVFDVRNEEEAVDLEGDVEAVSGFRIRRSAKLVKAAKKRDGHTCRACGFHFEDQIVHVHHLDPLSEYERPQETKLDDLITLCPNCHYLAHYWLREDSRYKQLKRLLAVLRGAGK
jgi:hypothetical protein